MQCQMDWFAIDPQTNQRKKAFSLTGTFVTHMSVTLRQLKIIPNLTFLRQEFKLHSSEIGQFTTEPLNTIFNFAFSQVIVPFVNQKFSDGIPIPTIPNVQLVNPHIGFHNYYILISSDVRYVGFSKHGNETLSK